MNHISLLAPNNSQAAAVSLAFKFFNSSSKMHTQNINSAQVSLSGSLEGIVNSYNTVQLNSSSDEKQKRHEKVSKSTLWDILAGTKFTVSKKITITTLLPKAVLLDWISILKFQVWLKARVFFAYKWHWMMRSFRAKRCGNMTLLCGWLSEYRNGPYASLAAMFSNRVRHFDCVINRGCLGRHQQLSCSIWPEYRLFELDFSSWMVENVSRGLGKARGSRLAHGC